MRKSVTPARGLVWTRRAILALPAMLLWPTASHAAASSTRYRAGVGLSADDIAWFRTLRSQWDDLEGGAPIILPDGIDPPATTFWDEEERSAYENRLEPIQCTFFLQAAFEPGRCALAKPLDGKAEVEVTPENITLLKATSWETFAVDPKAPMATSPIS